MSLVDTNVCIDVMRGKNPAVRRNLADAIDAGAEVMLSVLVVYELEVGIVRSADPGRARERLDAFLAGPFSIARFDAADANAAAAVRSALEAAGRPIGPLDVLIAGQAVARGVGLVTSNVREFSRVPMLRLVPAGSPWPTTRRSR
jgi:tRNA(fMet)-specific endonuclease VapC